MGSCERGPIAVSANRIAYVENVKIITEVEEKKPVQLKPHKTSVHEATHVVVAEKNGTRAMRATIIPGPGYRGLTELSRPDPLAAIGPHALGCNGTEGGPGSDVWSVEMMGQNKNSLVSAARPIIDQSHEEIYTVAEKLEEKGTIDSTDIRYAMEDAKKRKEEGKKASVVVQGPWGERKLTDVKVEDDVVMVPGEVVTLPQRKREPEEAVAA